MSPSSHRRPAAPLGVLGEFAAGVTWASIPETVQHRARLTLRDTIGTIYGGARTPAGRVAADVARRTPGSTPIPGLPGATSAPITAAFAGAVHASALDLDDGHYAGGAIHPASVIVPALLVAADGLASHGDVDHQDLLVAQVVGYEIGLRAAHLLWPNGEGALYHCTGTAATLGAAAAVARLRGADADTIARAIAIAWAHAPMATFQLPMVKESIGWSAATALFAADLAAAGFMRPAAGAPLRSATGGSSAIDATFTPTPFHRPGAMDDPFVASLGTVWEAGNTYFKPYACCRYTHTAIRSLSELMTAHDVTADDIATIEVHTHRGAIELRDIVPLSLDHAQYSFPFVLATQLVAGNVGAAELNAESLDDQQRLRVASRISVHHDPDLDACYPAHYATRLVVRSFGGQEWSITRLVAPGDPAGPMTTEELAAKFVGLLAPTIGDEAARQWSAALVDSSHSPKLR